MTSERHKSTHFEQRQFHDLEGVPCTVPKLFDFEENTDSYRSLKLCVSYELYEWVESDICSTLPKNAVWCSKDKDGSDIYFGKCVREQNILGVKIVPQRREAYVAYNGKEIHVANYKVLVNNITGTQIWVRDEKGFVPSNAVLCGMTSRGHRLYVGRTIHDGRLVPGYVNEYLRCISVAFGGLEYKYNTYEVLVNKM